MLKQTYSKRLRKPWFQLGFVAAYLVLSMLPTFMLYREIPIKSLLLLYLFFLDLNSDFNFISNTNDFLIHCL